MRITIVVGGRWHAFDLAQQLERQGYLHKIITNYPKWFVKRWHIPPEKIISLPATFWLVKAIYRLGGEKLMMRCQWRVHKWFAGQAARHLEGSDLIHTWSSFSEPTLLWAQAHGIPTVLERSSAHILEQSRLLREEHGRLGLDWAPTHPKIEQMEVREYSLATRIAVPSLFVERSFVERGYAQQKLYRNPFGVDLRSFYPPQSPPSPPTCAAFQVVYAGTLSVQKGIHDLVEGFRLAKLDGAQLTLLGGMTKEIKEILEKQSQPAVRLLGHRPQSELVSHYHRAHCFVMASIQDGFGMVLAQALACGLPLICTTNTGGEDLLRLEASQADEMWHLNGVIELGAGFLIGVNRPDHIAYCLRLLASHPELWRRKRESALRLASKNLSWALYGERAIENYRRMICSNAAHDNLE